MVQVSDPRPAVSASLRAPGNGVHGVFGRFPGYRPAIPSRPLHPVDGQLGPVTDGYEEIRLVWYKDRRVRMLT